MRLLSRRTPAKHVVGLLTLMVSAVMSFTANRPMVGFTTNTATLRVSTSEETPPQISSNDGSEKPKNISILRCINAVTPKTGALNEAVSTLANVTLEKANELISIGAVWARMDTLTEDDVMRQYNDFGIGSSATSVLYADLPKGWGGADEEVEGEDLDAYIERMESQRFRRILTPSVVEAGTDIRVYPQPRRFPSCYDMTSERLLYQDTTFIVVDKPPMLPTQVRTRDFVRMTRFSADNTSDTRAHHAPAPMIQKVFDLI